MDKKFLYDLMAEFEKRDIQELEFENEQGSIRLLKATASPAATAIPAALSAMPTEAGPTPVAAAEGAELIKAPIIGNFYRQPAPDAPYFVNEGERVSKGQTLCILEAMKLMNELEAEFDCEIIKVLVENGAMVEFDAPLFEVRRL